jgi:hypothetical protein
VIALSPALAQAQLQAIASALDAGAGGGLIRLYADARVAMAAVPALQHLLCELSFPKPCIKTLDSQKLALLSPADRLCLRSGVVTWARMLDGDGRAVLDVDVGLIDSDAEIELDNVQLLAGGSVRLPELEFYAASS